MPKQIELLFAGRFCRVERSVFSEQRLQLPVMLSIFHELLFCARERIEQAQLRLGREQRLVIVRAVKIDKFIAEIFQDRQRGWRTVDELPIVPPVAEKLRLMMRSFSHGSTPASIELRIEFLQIVPAKNRFDRAKIGSGANQRFVRAFA